MSFEVVSFPKIATAMSGFGIGIAPLIGGLGLAYAATKVVQKLHADYEAALADFKRREVEAQARQHAAQVQYMQATADAESLATAMAAAGAEASQVFVAASLEQILLAAQQNEMAEIHAKAQALLNALKENPNSEDLAQAAVKLTAELHTAIGKLSTTKATPAVKQLFDVARIEIGTLQTVEYRDSFLEQLTKLEALAVDETSVAMQGLANLRERSAKMIHAQIEAQAEKEQRRELTGQAVAMLQALSKMEDAPERKEAVAMLVAIGTLFSSGTAPSINDLQGYVNKAKALFDSCTNRLELAAKSAYITDAVADTLTELGYKVSHVPAEGNEGCLVSVAQDTGMMVMVDKEGNLKTEMVAFDNDATVPDDEMQEKVCSLVDQVFEGLRKRDIQIQEKIRRSFKKDQKLKVVEKPEVETPAAATKPKERAIP